MKPPATLGRMRVQFHIKVRSSPRLQDKCRGLADIPPSMWDGGLRLVRRRRRVRRRRGHVSEIRSGRDRRWPGRREGGRAGRLLRQAGGAGREKSQSPAGVVANTGIPFKALRETAVHLAGYRTRKWRGVDLQIWTKRRRCRTSSLLEHSLVRDLRRRVATNLENHNVDVFPGQAAFVDPNTVKVECPGRPRRSCCRRRCS